jgi:flagellar motility protein MotE (MotC chaperone)
VSFPVWPRSPTETSMSRNLSQIVADLFARPLEGKELSAQIQRLGLEMRIVMRGEDTIFGKFLGLLESFQAILPEEQQRYQAALQAISTTTKLSRQEIVRTMSGQLEELKIIEKNVIPSLTGWRDELKTMESRSQGLKGEIANLHARIAQLEGEERTVQAAMTAQQKDLEGTEKAIKQLLSDIGAELSALIKRADTLTAEAPAAQPAPPVAQPVPRKEPVKNDVPGKKKDGEQKVEIQTPPPQQDTKFQKKCPMCGGRFNRLELERKWQCYTCAHEEPDL